MLEWIIDRYNQVQEILEPFFNTFFLAVLLFLVGIIIGRIVSTLLAKFLRNADLNKLVSKSVGSEVPVEAIVTAFVRYFIYFIFVVMALNIIGITSYLLTIIAIGALIVTLFSIFLGFKDFIPNAIAGISLQQKGFIKKGDHISSAAVTGKIQSINLTDTIVKTSKGDTISIPNRTLNRSEIQKKAKSSRKH